MQATTTQTTTLQLFGNPQILHNNQNFELPITRPVFLLLYLAIRATWVSRDELMNIFWPDEHQTQAQQNLRVCLNRARTFEWANNTESEQRRLRWQPNTDLQEFKNALHNNNTSKAIATYHQLLSGYPVTHTPQFENWLEAERTNLHNQWHNAVRQRAQELERNHQHSQAAMLLALLMQSDDLCETTTQAYARNLARAGMREMAVRQLEEFKTRVWQSMQLSPTSQTESLLQAIRLGAIHS